MSNTENTTPQGTDDNTVVISPNTGLTGYRLQNFYITNVFQGFTWMLFHFTAVYFFTILLQNIALVGIFLGIANFIAFLVDIPLGILQRYISTKRFFIISAVLQLISVGIFLALILQVFNIINIDGLTPESVKSIKDWFFGSAINWVGVFVASICYGLAKEMNDVTSFGYILSNASPDQYGVILSRMNITFGIGSLSGLLLSWILLSWPSFISLVILGTLIAGFIFFTMRYFDNSVDSVKLEDIKEFTVSLKKFNIENVKENLVDTIKNTDLQKVVSNTKYLFLKPKQQKEKNEKIPWGNVMSSTKLEFGIIWKIISHNPLHYGLIWGLTLVLIFGFWDTFASSFLLDFLEEVKPGWSYILLAVIGVPGIVLQEVAIKLGDKIGARTVGIIGLALSSGSLLGMAILSIGTPSALAIIGIALINSLGYACGMAIGQNAFLDLYNRIYAKEQNLQEIDANASAGPMKVVQNLANVIGLVLGWLLLALGFTFFFFCFCAVVTATLVWTLRKKKEIQV